MIFLDFMFKVMTFAYLGFKSGFEVTHVTIVANFSLKMALK